MQDCSISQALACKNCVIFSKSYLLVFITMDVSLLWETGPRLNIKTVLSTYGNFHVKDKTAVRESPYLVRPSFLLRCPPGSIQWILSQQYSYWWPGALPSIATLLRMLPYIPDISSYWWVKTVYITPNHWYIENLWMSFQGLWQVQATHCITLQLRNGN